MKKKIAKKLINFLLWILRKLGWSEKLPMIAPEYLIPTVVDSYGLTPVKFRVRLDPVAIKMKPYSQLDFHTAQEWADRKRKGDIHAAKMSISKEIFFNDSHNLCSIVLAEDKQEYLIFEMFIDQRMIRNDGILSN